MYSVWQNKSGQSKQWPKYVTVNGFPSQEHDMARTNIAPQKLARMLAKAG